jgi:hypothetical protein
MNVPDVRQVRPDLLQAAHRCEHGRHYRRLATFLALYRAGGQGAGC